MEKRLAASMAGLAELTTLRERHRWEMEDLLVRLTVNQQQLAAPPQDRTDTPPPVPERNWTSTPINSPLRPPPPAVANTTDNHGNYDYDTLDQTSTFRRPRQLSESVHSYPSPMHAVLMQYPHSDTRMGSGEGVNQGKTSNGSTSGKSGSLDESQLVAGENQGDISQGDQIRPQSGKCGFLETTFPANDNVPICSHCQHASYDACMNHNAPICSHCQHAGYDACANHKDNTDTASHKHKETFGIENDPHSLAGITRLLKLRETQHTGQIQALLASQDQADSDSSHKPRDLQWKPLHAHQWSSPEQSSSPVGQLQGPHKSSRNSRNLSMLSEEGYFSSSDLPAPSPKTKQPKGRSSNCQSVQSMSSLFSNDSCFEDAECCVTDSCSNLESRVPVAIGKAGRLGGSQQPSTGRNSTFVVEERGEEKLYSFCAAIEDEPAMVV